MIHLIFSVPEQGWNLQLWPPGHKMQPQNAQRKEKAMKVEVEKVEDEDQRFQAWQHRSWASDQMGGRLLLFFSGLFWGYL